MRILSLTLIFYFTKLVDNLNAKASKNYDKLKSATKFVPLNDIKRTQNLINSDKSLPELIVDLSPENNVPLNNDIVKRTQNLLEDDGTLPELIVDLSLENNGYFRRYGYDHRLDKLGLHKAIHHVPTDDDDGTTSSSEEQIEWKNQWNAKWRALKRDALMALIRNETRGDVINMAAIRPWQVPCGDQNQHDLPWGTCMMPSECMPEFRIYRGDNSCGKNKFVCCGVMHGNRDLYQAFDLSMAETSAYSTSSEERARKNRGSREKRRLHRSRKRKRLAKQRYRRKRFMKQTIRKLAKEIRKELNRAFRNNTRQRGRIKNNLKKLIRNMKKRFKHEREVAKVKYNKDLVGVDTRFTGKLKQVRDFNFAFLKNATFREILINGTLTRQGRRLILEAYPELGEDPEIGPYLRQARRFGGSDVEEREGQRKDFLDYDVELGMEDV